MDTTTTARTIDEVTVATVTMDSDKAYERYRAELDTCRLAGEAFFDALQRAGYMAVFGESGAYVDEHLEKTRALRDNWNRQSEKMARALQDYNMTVSKSGRL